MDALTALHTRNSVNVLTDPGPSQAQLDNIFKAGLRACDHRCLRPWRYLIIEGNARNRFGELLCNVKATIDGKPLDNTLYEKIKSKPLRAPTIVVVVAKISEHDKVPELEQLLSAGGSAQMMMTAAHAQGIGAIWRSGQLMFHPETSAGLGLDQNDQIVGFIYLGTPRATKPVPELNINDFAERWTGE